MCHPIKGKAFPPISMFPPWNSGLGLGVETRTINPVDRPAKHHEHHDALTLTLRPPALFANLWVGKGKDII
jgi:hypothetical protein